MRKLLFTLTAAAISVFVAEGQTRLSLYEEFSGENCGPCATYNPGLWSLISGNSSKIMLIKYQSPIPSAGPIYNAYKTVTNARIAYYSVPFAPYGVQNGNEVTGNISTYSQSNINASVANPAPFSLSVTHQWNPAGDSITANVTVTASSAYAPTGANLKLRVALVEHLSYCSAPGTNGETEFHNVVREMYPDANGTSLPNSWTASQSQSITVSGKVPAFVDKSNNDAIVVVWIQNDADKNIVQAAKSIKSSLPLDASLAGCFDPELACATGTANIGTTATLTNTGSTPLTTATIYYKLDNGALSSFVWNGSLAPGGSTALSIPALSMSVGKHVVYDSVALPNSAADVNLANNVVRQQITVRDATPAMLPLSTDFELGGAVPANWTLFDADGNGLNWAIKATAGHNSSIHSILHNNFFYAAGEVNYAVLPTGTLPSGSKALDFYVAYAQYTTENDKLEVVYSTDCGDTWNTVWSAMGADLATHAPVGNNVQFIPVQADWRLKSIDISTVPAGATIALRATSDYGNNLYVDDVNLRIGAATGIRTAIIAGDVTLFPNPATEAAALRFTLARKTALTISVIDALGRSVAVAAEGTMQAGAHQVNIPVGGLAPGLYTIAIRSSEGVQTQRLSVLK